MRYSQDDLIAGAFLVSLVALAVASVVAIVADAKEWDAFREAHHCKVVAHIRGDTFNTFSTNSKGTLVVGIGSTPSKKGWLCDDGITYYR
jgi:hypothetical protein